MIPMVVEAVKKLSQEYGLSDQEIADMLGCCRATVQRARAKHGIPIANRVARKERMKMLSQTVTQYRQEK